jgi:hypothetical protein
MLMGRSEDELWRDMDPVLRDLLDMEGDKVATMMIDRPGRRVRVDVEWRRVSSTARASGSSAWHRSVGPALANISFIELAAAEYTLSAIRMTWQRQSARRW